MRRNDNRACINVTKNVTKKTANFTKKEHISGGINGGLSGGKKLDKLDEKILHKLIKSNNITIEKIALSVDRPVRTIENRFKKLREAGYIRRVGSKKSGHWEVTL